MKSQEEWPKTGVEVSKRLVVGGYLDAFSFLAHDHWGFGAFFGHFDFTCKRRESPLIFFYGDNLRFTYNQDNRQACAIAFPADGHQEKNK
jgi:hypothetical protein